MSSKKHVDADHLTVTGTRPSHVAIEDDGVTIIVTQCFGPTGESLVGISDVKFDGWPAVSVGVRKADGTSGVVHLSPIHGDPRKETELEIATGDRCELYCPVSDEPLDKVGEVEDGSGASYYALYLTPKLDKGAMVMVSDIWGHYHSRIVDDMELISYWARTHDLDD